MTSSLFELADTAASLDEADPLIGYRSRFLRHDDPGIVAYLDGNSLGRPLAASAERLAAFVTDEWAGRLIRGWDESWYELPLTIGDRLGDIVLGAAAGQTTIGDSTTVLLYKLACGALNLRPGRTEIVLDRENFPTDRYLIESIAADRGLVVRWIDVDLAGGVTTDALDAVVSAQTALVVLSHVAYRSGYLIDVPAAVDIIHGAGALLLLDLCHSAGSVEVDLDGWGVDFAAGCTYKYLNGGPGSPAFAYVAACHLDDFRQPVWGWMGRHNPFEMEQGYVPAQGIRRVISGTPAIIGMLPIQDSVDLIAEAGITAIRAKSVALTEFALQAVDTVLGDRGVVVSSPRDPQRRGGHITIDHPDFKAVTATLWERGIIPDFRRPDGIRLGLSPLSTSFPEVLAGVSAIAEQLGG